MACSLSEKLEIVLFIRIRDIEVRIREQEDAIYQLLFSHGSRAFMNYGIRDLLYKLDLMQLSEELEKRRTWRTLRVTSQSI